MGAEVELALLMSVVVAGQMLQHHRGHPWPIACRSACVGDSGAIEHIRQLARTSTPHTRLRVELSEPRD